MRISKEIKELVQGVEAETAQRALEEAIFSRLEKSYKTWESNPIDDRSERMCEMFRACLTGDLSYLYVMRELSAYLRRYSLYEILQVAQSVVYETFNTYEFSWVGSGEMKAKELAVFIAAAAFSASWGEENSWGEEKTPVAYKVVLRVDAHNFTSPVFPLGFPGVTYRVGEWERRDADHRGPFSVFATLKDARKWREELKEYGAGLEIWECQIEPSSVKELWYRKDGKRVRTPTSDLTADALKLMGRVG